MSLADTALLTAELNLKGNFVSNVKGAQKALSGFDAKLTDTQGRAYKAGQQIGTGIKNGAKVAAVGLGLLLANIGLGLDSLVKLESATLQTEAVIKSTGGAAGITAKDVQNLAEKFESLNATIGDEVITETENMLLTFTNVRKEAFEPALEAILDMNAAMGGGPDSLQGVAIQVGKALNDPTKGLTALSRVGVTFTKEQKKRIKDLQEEGDLYGAQQIILAELNKEFGGSFLAGGSGTAGKVAKVTDSVEDLQRALATALLPAIGKVADKLSAFLQDPAVVAGISELGDNIAGLFSDDNINTGADALKGLFQLAKDAAPAIQSAAEVTGKIIGTAVDLFKALPPEIQALAVAGLAINKLTGGLVTNIAGGLIGSVLKQLVSGVVNVQGATVVVTGGVGGGVGAAAGAAGGGLGGAVAKTIPLVGIAFIGHEAASQLNQSSRAATGIDTNFTFDRSFFGIPGALQNIGEVLRVIAGTPKAVRHVGKDVDDLSSITRAGYRRIGQKASEQAAETRRLRSTVRAQGPNRVVNNITIPVKTYIDGRQLSSDLERYRKATGSGR